MKKTIRSEDAPIPLLTFDNANKTPGLDAHVGVGAEPRVRPHVEDGPCDCGHEHRLDHREFGLPLGCSWRCERCGAMWA